MNLISSTSCFGEGFVLRLRFKIRVLLIIFTPKLTDLFRVLLFFSFSTPTSLEARFALLIGMQLLYLDLSLFLDSFTVAVTVAVAI